MNATAWEDFQKNAFWKSIESTLRDWIDGVKDLPYTSEFSSREERLDEFARCEGRIEAMNYFLGLPQTFVEALQFDEEKEDGT